MIVFTLLRSARAARQGLEVLRPRKWLGLARQGSSIRPVIPNHAVWVQRDSPAVLDGAAILEACGAPSDVKLDSLVKIFRVCGRRERGRERRLRKVDDVASLVLLLPFLPDVRAHGGKLDDVGRHDVFLGVSIVEL